MNKIPEIKYVRIVKIVLIILYIVGVIIIATYPFHNSSITITVYSDNNNQSITLEAEEISRLPEFTIEINNFVVEEITEIGLSRKFKSVCIDKISLGNLNQYIKSTTSNSIIFNNEMCELIKSHSKSYLLERLIYAQVLLTFLLAVGILINVFSERLNRNQRSNHGPLYEIKKFIKDFIQYWRYMVYAANADLKAEVANSYLNRLWWLLEPLFNMLVYVIVFGRIMGNSIQNYATFVFSSLLMWNFFSKTVNYSVKCIRNNRDIVTKVYVPKHVLLISNMILNFFKLLFSLTVLVPMLFIFHVRVGIGILWIIPVFMLMIILSFGVGMIFLHYGVYIDDLGYAVGILLQMLMFLSGIFYEVITSLFAPLNVIMLCGNPLAMLVDTMRNALLDNRVTNIPLIVLWTVLSLLVSYIGIHIVYKNENGYVKVV